MEERQRRLLMAAEAGRWGMAIRGGRQRGSRGHGVLALMSWIPVRRRERGAAAGGGRKRATMWIRAAPALLALSAAAELGDRCRRCGGRRSRPNLAGELTGRA